MSKLFVNGDYIRLVERDQFSARHSSNKPIARKIAGQSVRVVRTDGDGDITCLLDEHGNIIDDILITRHEFIHFEIDNHPFATRNNVNVGDINIIITYIEEGKTIEERGITEINITDITISYSYSYSKLGFLKYKGEVELPISDLKQITVNTKHKTQVFHIENGIIVREHIMYDNTRKFSNFKITAS